MPGNDYIERLAKAICYAEFTGFPGIHSDAYWDKVAKVNKDAYRSAARAAHEKLNEVWPGAHSKSA